ncbi:CHAT domain-containing protein [Streptomyces sp. Je 1-79]|uniref:CHAT domain-containing protein n=1 Tax=Streptomyces sp. Je 1-79 TaxID=2943847 RepID=UPI0021A6E4E0|nr:CHAT domain-containing protein [Streptomyces sp. Je 1-79]MCT4353798.1 CHAT domain-containing protein [Streptomyces sp. Je 1-79]
MDAEKSAQRILDRVQRVDADPGALRWFLTEEAAEAADAVRRAGTLPDGNVLLTTVHAIAYYDWCRHLAGEETDMAALGSAVIGFLDVHRASPAHVPPLLAPVLALLAGEPAGADADPGDAYRAGAGVLALYTRHRHPALLPAAALLLRHAVAGFPAGSAEQGTCLSDLGLTMLYGSRDGGGPGLLAEAVHHSRASVAAAPGERAEQARRQGNLGLVLKHAAEATEDPATARESVDVLRGTLRVSLPGDPYHALHLALLGSALLTAAVGLHDPALLPEAVEVLRRSAAASPEQPPPAAHLNDLGTALVTLSLAPVDSPHGQDRTALHDEGVDTCRRAAAIAGNPVEGSLYLANLAHVLNGRTVKTRSPVALEDAHSAARDALTAAPSGHPAHTHAQHILSEVLRTRYVETGVLADLEAAIGYARSALDATAAEDPRHGERALDLAALLRVYAGAVGGASEALAEPLALLRGLAADTPPHSRRRARVLLELARTLEATGDGAGETAETAAAEAERTFRECLALTDAVGDDTTAVTYALGHALAWRAAAHGDSPRPGAEERRREGITLIHRALGSLDQDDPRRSEYLSSLGCVHLEHATATRDRDEYGEAVRLLRLAVAAAPPTGGHDRAVACSNLGAALMGLGGLTADEALLAEGVRAHRDAVAATAPGDHYGAHRLGNLGDALDDLAQFRSDVGLAREAVEVLREAVRASSPTAPGRGENLSRLGTALRSLSRFTGDDAPLEEAVHWHRQAVAVAEDPGSHRTDAYGAGTRHTATARARAGLANVLAELHLRTYDEALREEALAHYRAALASPHDPGSRHALLTSYGTALCDRAADTADDTLMGTAIGVLREATAVVPADHTGRAGVLSNLGLALMRRSRMTGDRRWLDEGVDVLRRAVRQSPPTSFERAAQLSNLAEALRVRYEATHDRTAADEAAGLLREAISLDHGERHGRDIARVSLGVLLHRTALGAPDEDTDTELLAEARRVLEEAVAGLDDRHPRRTVALINLAGACMITAELAEDTADPALEPLLARGVGAAREALGRLPEGHPHESHAQWVLARAQLARARLGDGAVDRPVRSEGVGRPDLAEAVRLARQAAHSPVASVSKRLLAARTWGEAAAAAGQDAEALTGHTYAVGLLPRLAPRGLGRADQEDRLVAGTGLASDAAALALRQGDPEAALTLLEQGRGVLLAQGLESRGDLSRLRTADPELAAEFERVRDALGTGPSGPDTIPTDLEPADPTYSGHRAGLLAESRHALARTWDELLDRIRRLPGLEGFLTPPSVAELLGAASGGPVVVVNVSRYRSDALLVTARDGIQVVPLPALTPLEVLDRATEFVSAIDDAYGDRGAREAVAAMGTLSGTLEWLWTAVAAPVLDRLGLRTTPRDGAPWPRLWWCPTGWLALLPLHAAGRAGSESVMERVVSSYTPTLRALDRARNAPSLAATALPSPLIVTLAETPGAPSLPGASQEAELLRKLFPSHVELAGPAATVDAVRRALPAHPWVHFSCHGVSEPHQPSRSGLILHDGRLTAHAAAEQRPGEAVLAVLSACSTSQGGFTLPDESVQLAASFQLAGYPHVIGTLWPVADKVATRLTEKLYGALTDDLARGRPVDPATALHRPVRELRRRLARAPHLWAAHIHTGP